MATPDATGTGAQVEILPLTVVARSFAARPSSLPDVRDFVRRQLTGTAVTDDDVRHLCDRVAEVLLEAAGLSGTISVSLRIFPDAAEVDVLFATEPSTPPADRAFSISPGPAAGPASHRPPAQPGPAAPSGQAAHSGQGRQSGAAGLSGPPAAASTVVSPPALSGPTWPDPDMSGSGRSGRAQAAHAPAGHAYAGPEADLTARPATEPPGPPQSFADWFAGRLRRESLTMEAAARRLDVSAKTISRWVAGSTEPRLRDLLRIRDIFGEPPIH